MKDELVKTLRAFVIALVVIGVFVGGVIGVGTVCHLISVHHKASVEEKRVQDKYAAQIKEEERLRNEQVAIIELANQQEKDAKDSEQRRLDAINAVSNVPNSAPTTSTESDVTSVASTGVGMGVIVILVGLYFLPTVIAASRGHKNAAAILVLNLLLGWTVLGWIIALVWSFTSSK
jgi:hypothetical protein